MSILIETVLTWILVVVLIVLLLWAAWKGLYAFAVLTIPLWPRRWVAFFNKGPTNRRALPESLFVVTVTEEGVTCAPPEGEPSTITWEDLASVYIRTNDSGPFGVDVIWGLHDGSDVPRILVPGGATGEEQMLAALQRLPGFDNGMVVAAMSSTQNARFLCWKRQRENMG